VQALNLLGEPPWRPAAAKGFPDEDAAWIDGLAQRLDVANQLARRVAATTDPELRWRRSTTSAGFSWIPAYGQKIDSEVQFPIRAREFPVRQK